MTPPHAVVALKDINDSVIINSKIDDRNSLLQLNYLQNEPGQSSPVGILKLILKTKKLKCFPADQTLSFFDPHSKEQRLYFKVIDGSSLTIHKKKNNRVRISGSRTARYIKKQIEYEDYEEIEESIVTEADKEEKDLGYFTYK